MSEFELAQASCSTGGWARSRKPRETDLRLAERRWALRSHRHGRDDPDQTYQCGGCVFFAALGADYGICWNKVSSLDGCIVFEHGGCPEHSERENTVTLP